MRKVLFLVLSVVLFCACQGPQGIPGPQGPAGADGAGVNWKIADLNVTQWDYSNYSDNNYFYAKFSVPALTSYVFNDGNVNGYILLQENGETIQHSLPYVLPIYEKGTDQTFFFTRTVDFVYGVGWVQIELRESDFDYEVNTSYVPDPMNFRIVMTY